MSSLATLRKQLQGPRKAVDTWYGKNVMRRVSIYLTWVFSQLGLSPNIATTLSLISALLGAWFLSGAEWGLGVFFVNLWYLLDHVDGELARYYKRASASGLFYDTTINFLAQPLTLIGLGWGLGWGQGAYLLFGLLGAFGYLMLSLIPMCEASILLEKIQTRGSLPHRPAPATRTSGGSFLKRAFSTLHQISTFPNFLMVFTVLYLVTVLFPVQHYDIFCLFLIFYSLACTVIWTTQLFQKVYSKKLDQHPWIKEA